MGFSSYKSFMKIIIHPLQMYQTHSMAAIIDSLPFSAHTSSSWHSDRFKFCQSLKPTNSIKIHRSILLPSSLSLIQNATTSPHLLSSSSPTPKLRFGIGCSLQEATVEEKTLQIQETNIKKKICVLNLPWSLLSVEKIRELFGQCGTISDVEIIKHRNGTGRGYIFVTMDSGEQAQAVIDKFDSQEIEGRVIRVEFSKRMKKPPSSPPVNTPGETRHKIYVSNLSWKAKSVFLRDFITENFRQPASTKVVGSPNGRSAGYGFVSFLTEDEAEAAISALDGKEFMGRPLRLKLSERTVESVSENQEQVSEDQSEQS